MKIELEVDDIQTIANKIIQEIKPLLKELHIPKNNEWLGVKELSKYLKVKESWIYEKTYKKEIPFKKAGKFPRFRKSHIDLWIENPYHPDLSIYNLNHNGKGVRKK